MFRLFLIVHSIYSFNIVSSVYAHSTCPPYTDLLYDQRSEVVFFVCFCVCFFFNFFIFFFGGGGGGGWGDIPGQ